MNKFLFIGGGNRPRFLQLISFLVLTLVLLGCPNDVKKPDPDTSTDGIEKLAGISFSQKKVTLSTTNRSYFELLDVLEIEPKEANYAIEFTSSDPEVVGVSFSGALEARSKGTCTITAKADTYEASIDVEVIDTKLDEVNYKIILYTEKIESDEFDPEELTRKAYPGDVLKIYPEHFRPKDFFTFDAPYHQFEVAADGSTVVKVYIKRKVFTITFDMGDGTVQTYTGKYEADFTPPPPPTREGLTFFGWYPISLPSRFLENATYKAYFDNPNASIMERFKALLPFPAYDSSMGHLEFQLTPGIGLPGGESADLAWASTGSYSCPIHGDTLYIVPDIVPQDLTLTAIITYEGFSEIVSHTIHVDPITEYSDTYDSKITFTPDNTYQSGKVRLDSSKYHRYSAIYDYTVDPKTRELNLNLDRHYIDMETYIELYEYFLIPNLHVGWYKKGEFEKLFNDNYNKLIADIDTYYKDDLTKDSLINLVKSNNSLKIMLSIATNTTNAEIEKNMNEWLNVQAGGVAFAELTPEKQNNLLATIKNDRIIKHILDMFYYALGVYAPNWEELKSIATNINLYETSIVFGAGDIATCLPSIMDSQLCSYIIPHDAPININTKYDSTKSWHRQIASFDGKDGSNSHSLNKLKYLYNYTRYSGTWNDTYTTLNVKSDDSSGIIYVTPSREEPGKLHVHGKITDAADPSNVKVDISASSPVELEFRDWQVFW